MRSAGIPTNTPANAANRPPIRRAIQKLGQASGSTCILRIVVV